MDLSCTSYAQVYKSTDAEDNLFIATLQRMVAKRCKYPRPIERENFWLSYTFVSFEGSLLVETRHLLENCQRLLSAIRIVNKFTLSQHLP